MIDLRSTEKGVQIRGTWSMSGCCWPRLHLSACSSWIFWLVLWNSVFIRKGSFAHLLWIGGSANTSSGFRSKSSLQVHNHNRKSHRFNNILGLALNTTLGGQIIYPGVFFYESLFFMFFSCMLRRCLGTAHIGLPWSQRHTPCDLSELPRANWKWWDGIYCGYWCRHRSKL